MSKKKYLETVKRFLPWIIFIVSIIYLSRSLFLHFYPDFTNYYYGPQDWFTGKNPYLGERQLFTPFVYPPTVLWLFLPLTLLSFPIAEVVWTITSIILLLLSLHLMYRMHNTSFFSSENLLISSVILLFYFPLKFTLGMGQINIFILFLIVLSLFFMEKHKSLFSGVFLSFAIVIKLFPPLLVCYFLLRRQWKILFSVILTSVLLIIITYVVVKPPLIVYFYQQTLPSLLGSWKGDYYNQALSGLLTREVSNVFARRLIKDVITIIFFATSLIVAWMNKQKEKQLLIIGLLITVSILLNNFSWQHHFTWLLMPFLFVYFYLRKHGGSFWYFFTLFISFFLVGFNFKNPHVIPLLLQSHVFFGGLLLWILIMLIVFKPFTVVGK